MGGNKDSTWVSVTRGKSCVVAVGKNLEGTREDTRERSSVIAENSPSVEAERLLKSETDGENISRCDAANHHIRF